MAGVMNRPEASDLEDGPLPPPVNCWGITRTTEPASRGESHLTVDTRTSRRCSRPLDPDSGGTHG